MMSSNDLLSALTHVPDSDRDGTSDDIIHRLRVSAEKDEEGRRLSKEDVEALSCFDDLVSEAVSSRKSAYQEAGWRESDEEPNPYWDTMALHPDGVVPRAMPVDLEEPETLSPVSDGQFASLKAKISGLRRQMGS